MKCPFCSSIDTQVKDSRPVQHGVRRRRICPECKSRFTTLERPYLRALSVIKNNGYIKPFDRDKIYNSIAIAARKRPLNSNQIEQIVNQIVYELENSASDEVSSKYIGKLVMEALAEIDHVAYIRFASVYKNFAEVKDFDEILKKFSQQ
ncbi:transcriptional repressor NrdR [Rickettsiales bacterium]|nr:transcriptional repressor NrdR [Rickettsiales bacterium]